MLVLKDKVALITGSAQGIGAAIARTFVQQGAQVIITDIQEEKGKALAKELGAQAFFLRLNVTLEQDWVRAMAVINEKYGSLHVLVNNAGITGYHLELGPHDPEHSTLAGWNAVHEVNLTGVFLGCKYGIAAMKANLGHSTIINISSRSGLVGISRAAAYASSKAAIRNHTKTVALYCAEMGYKITCNSVHPAAILTPMWDDMLGVGNQREKMIRHMSKDIPLGRFGQPEEVAQLVLYLASHQARYITGTEFNIDGGILAGSAAAPQQEEPV
ncbi:MAG TPA: SDR family oxidoreductase [Flavisolibacter sp.]|nr:SDR family oxidoreductase [Flavisolibacter sp.]